MDEALKKDEIDLDKLNELSSLADILSFHSSTSNQDDDAKSTSDVETKAKSDMFGLTQTKSFKANKTKKKKDREPND